MNESNRKKIDPILMLILITMSLTSLIAIYSAIPLINSNYSPAFILGKQVAWILLGFGLMLFMYFIGTERFELLIYISYYVLLLALLLLVIQRYFEFPFLSKFIRMINGSYAWYTLPGVGTIQPSEFMKVVLIIIVANVIEKHHKLYPKNTYATDFKLILDIMKYVIPPALLIYYEPDSGVTLIILFSIAFMLLASGIKSEWFIIGAAFIGIILLLVGILYLSNPEFVIDYIIGGDYKILRIMGWLKPEEYILSYGNQLYTSLLAIGSAGKFGHGLQNVPLSIAEAQTDFIFAVIGSSFGVIGSVFVVFLCLCLDLRLLYIGYRTKKNRNKYIIAGLVGILAFQQIENMGMITGLLPITGITLPLISAGGSSMLSYMIILSFVFQMYNEFEQKAEVTEVNATRIKN